MKIILHKYLLQKSFCGSDLHEQQQFDYRMDRRYAQKLVNYTSLDRYKYKCYHDPYLYYFHY